jgi:hypothetical protein
MNDTVIVDNKLRVIENPPESGKTSWTVDELLGTDFPEPTWIVPGLVPTGLVFLAGRPKVGKSWLALQMSIAVGSGGRTFGQDIEQGKVLYLALEDSPRRLRERLIIQQCPHDAQIRFEIEWPKFGCEGGTTQLGTEIATNRYNLIVIDTLSRAAGNADQLDLAQMTNLTGELQSMAMKYNCTILVVDHHRKSNAAKSNNPIDDIMGSTGKSAVCDSAMGLYRDKSGATLLVTGREIEDKEIALHWDGQFCMWQALGETGSVVKKGSMEDLVLKNISELTSLEQDATVTHLSIRMNKAKGSISKALKSLAGKGRIYSKTTDGQVAWVI